MWTGAQRDGRPVEYRLCGANEERKFRNPFLATRRKVWLTRTARVPCCNAANIGERKTWTQREFCMAEFR